MLEALWERISQAVNSLSHDSTGKAVLPDQYSGIDEVAFQVANRLGRPGSEEYLTARGEPVNTYKVGDNWASPSPRRGIVDKKELAEIQAYAVQANHLTPPPGLPLEVRQILTALAANVNSSELTTMHAANLAANERAIEAATQGLKPAKLNAHLMTAIETNSQRTGSLVTVDRQHLGLLGNGFTEALGVLERIIQTGALARETHQTTYKNGPFGREEVTQTFTREGIAPDRHPEASLQLPDFKLGNLRVTWGSHSSIPLQSSPLSEPTGNTSIGNAVHVEGGSINATGGDIRGGGVTLKL